MIEAFSEQLITIDELRARMPHLRARQANLRGQIDAADTQAADREAYLQLADNLESFLAQLQGNAATASIPERQRVLRLLVKDILIGPQTITIRHRIPARGNTPAARKHDTETDTEGDHRQSYPLRWGRANSALGSTFFSRRDPFPGLEHPCPQPPGDHSPRGETAERLKKVLVADLVERACQVRVKNPHPRGLPAQGLEQRLDRVVAAAARPEPIRPGLEPGLHLGFQVFAHPALMAGVGEQGDSEGSNPGFVTGFGYVPPPDRGRLMRADAGVHVHRHLGPCLAGQGDLPVDPRRPAARVALRRLPHADQRVAPAPQHQLLQAPGRRPVTLPHRLEDPAAQPPYLLLMTTPVHTLPGITIKYGQALRSAHRGVQLAHQYRHFRSLRIKGPPAHVSSLTGTGTRPVIRPVIHRPSGGVPGPAAHAFLLPFSRRHSLVEHPVPPGTSAPLTVGLPHRLRIPAPEIRTLAGRVGPGRGAGISTSPFPRPALRTRRAHY